MNKNIYNNISFGGPRKKNIIDQIFHLRVDLCQENKTNYYYQNGNGFYYDLKKGEDKADFFFGDYGCINDVNCLLLAGKFSKLIKRRISRHPGVARL